MTSRPTSRQAPPPPLGEFEQLTMLAVLQCDGEAYTVPIRRTLEDKAGRRISRGAIHTTLERLEGKRLLTSRLGEPLAVRGGRARRYYDVTPRGVEALRAARVALARLSSGLESLLDPRR